MGGHEVRVKNCRMAGRGHAAEVKIYLSDKKQLSVFGQRPHLVVDKEFELVDVVAGKNPALIEPYRRSLFYYLLSEE